MTDNRNTILAVILSGLVLIGWQYFFNIPQMEKQRAQQAQSELAKPAPQPAAGHALATPQSGAPSAPGHGTQSARRGAAGGQPRGRDRRRPAHQDRDPEGQRQHFIEGRAHRRSGAGPVPHHRRPQIARDRAVLAFGHGDALLRGIRLGRRRPAPRSAARPEHALAAGRFGQPRAEQPGDPEIRQWRRPHLPPHHRESTSAISSPSRTTSPISAMRRSRCIRSR